MCTIRTWHCRCSVFDIPGLKSGPILGARFRTQNGSVFQPLNKKTIKGARKRTHFGSGIWCPKWVRFSDPECRKLSTGSATFEPCISAVIATAYFSETTRNDYEGKIKSRLYLGICRPSSTSPRADRTCPTLAARSAMRKSEART